ncbi:MAG: 16S rRNA (uracil(1498)-N(3))-methyltransferase [bacterium]|nr:16S rRNA (uracil(1498)-N(3))-methyltransferase [bacterium]
MVARQHGDFVYVGDARRDGSVFLLSNDEAHHLSRVRRRREGQRILATDGNGLVFEGILGSNNTLQIERELPALGEPRVHFTLICGCLQGDSARDVVDSAVQLGVRVICWVRMQQSQESYAPHRLERLHRVAIQSLKQTGRAYLPVQSVEDNFAAALETVRPCPLFVAHPHRPEKQESAIGISDSAALIVGPEGGLADGELALLHERGARTIALGNRRLRTETAVTAGLSYLLTRSGEFHP